MAAGGGGAGDLDARPPPGGRHEGKDALPDGRRRGLARPLHPGEIRIRSSGGRSPGDRTMAEVKLEIDGRALRGPGRDDRPQGRRTARHRHPALLLPSRLRAGGELPDVPGRDRGPAQARPGLFDRRPRGDEGPDGDAAGSSRPAGTSSSSSWPTTRSTARSATRRASASCRIITTRTAATRARFLEAKEKKDEEGPARQGPPSRPRALHPLQPLRPLPAAGDEDGGAGHLRARRQVRDRPRRRRRGPEQLLRQPRRHLPRRGHHGHGFPVQDPGLVPEERADGLPALRPRLRHRRPVGLRLPPARGPAQGLPDRAGREPRRQRLLDLRPRPLRRPRTSRTAAWTAIGEGGRGGRRDAALLGRRPEGPGRRQSAARPPPGAGRGWGSS